MKRSEVGKKFIGKGILEGASAGLPTDALNPFFEVDDPDAEILGTTESGKPIAAMKVSDGTTDVWFVTPKINRGLIEPIIKRSGAHIWCDSGDPILACGGFAAINSPAGGKRVINLPDGSTRELELEPFTTEVIEY